MRVVLLTENFPRSEQEDPVFPAGWQLARALRRAGHELLVVTWTHGEADVRERVDGIDVLRRSVGHAFPQFMLGGPSWLASFASANAFALELHRSTRDAVREFRPDVVESQEFHGLALYWALAREYPLVLRCYGPAYHLMLGGELGAFSTLDGQLTAVLELAPLLIADGLICICSDMAAKLGAATGIDPAEFRIIRAPFAPSPDSPTPAPEPPGTGFPSLFTWGRVDSSKGADLLVKAMPDVVASYPGARLAIGGTLATEHGSPNPYADTMRHRLTELGLSDRVEFLGPLPRPEIRKRAIAADICVFPSKYETAGYCALEALSYGACVAAAAAGGLPEYHRHGESTWLFAPRDSDALSAAIRTLAGDASLRSRLRSAGPAQIRLVCDPERIARESMEVYETAVVRFRERGSRSPRTLEPVLERLAAALRERPLTVPTARGNWRQWIRRALSWRPFRS